MTGTNFYMKELAGFRIYKTNVPQGKKTKLRFYIEGTKCHKFGWEDKVVNDEVMKWMPELGTHQPILACDNPDHLDKARAHCLTWASTTNEGAAFCDEIEDLARKKGCISRRKKRAFDDKVNAALRKKYCHGNRVLEILNLDYDAFAATAKAMRSGFDKNASKEEVSTFAADNAETTSILVEAMPKKAEVPLIRENLVGLVDRVEAQDEEMEAMKAKPNEFGENFQNLAGVQDQHGQSPQEHDQRFKDFRAETNARLAAMEAQMSHLKTGWGSHTMESGFHFRSQTSRPQSNAETNGTKSKKRAPTVFPGAPRKKEARTEQSTNPSTAAEGYINYRDAHYEIVNNSGHNILGFAVKDENWKLYPVDKHGAIGKRRFSDEKEEVIIGEYEELLVGIWDLCELSTRIARLQTEWKNKLELAKSKCLEVDTQIEY